MPLGYGLKIVNFVVKYVPENMPIEGIYEARYEDVEKCISLWLQASTAHEFLLACTLVGGAVAVIGVILYFLKDRINLPAWPILNGSVIFEVTIPADQEDEFARYVANELGDELNQLFSDVENHLRKEMGDDVDSVPKDVLEALKATKISSVVICDDEAVKQAKEAAKHAAKKVSEPPPLPPKNLKIKENPQSPSTSLLVFYERPDQGTVDKYVVVAQDLDGATKKKPIEQETSEEYTLVRNLQPGQSYLIWVQSVRNGVRSTKALLRDPVRTAQYDPHPWRAWDATSSVADSGLGTASVSGDPKALSEIGDQEESEAPAEDPDLWKSDLHVELRKILRVRFPDSKMKRLLFKCDELGIVEAKDLKFLDSKEITDELKGTIKPVEILKLMDYAKDQYTTSSGTSKEDTKGRGNVYQFSIKGSHEARIALNNNS